MSALAPVRIRYGFEKSYPGTWSPQGVGAQAQPYRRGWLPPLPLFEASVGVPGAVTSFCRVKGFLYVGGEFALVGGVARVGLARIDLSTGELDTSFDAQLDGGGAVVSALATDGSNLYVGGSFATAQGEARPRLVKFTEGGQVDLAFEPTPDGTLIEELCYRTGNQTLYVAGDFTVLGGEVRDDLGEVSTINGQATAFDAGVINGTSSIRAMVYVLADDTLIIGGGFTSVNGGTGRNRLAKLDADTGTATSWDPDADGPVRALAYSGGLLYVGGNFANVGGEARANLAAITSAAVATTFDPSPSGQVWSVAVDDAGRVFAGYGTTDLSAYDPNTSAQISWDPAPDQTVTVLVAYKSTIWAGGLSLSAVNGIGSTTEAVSGGAAVPFPLFRDDNTIFVKQNGAFEDVGDGTHADPKRTLWGAVGTEPSFSAQAVGGVGLNHLTQTGVVQHQWESFTKPVKGHWMAGLFDDSDYLNVPAAIGTAWASSNAFTVQIWFYLESLAAVNTLWDWQNGTGDVRLTVDTNGAVNFNIHGTTDSSANQVVNSRQWYCVTLEKNPGAGDTKRAWLSTPGQRPVLIINTVQSATLGSNTSHRLAKHRSSSNQFLVGVLGPVMMLDSAYISGLSDFSAPLDWRVSADANCLGYWPMQTISVLEDSPSNRYVCILDSETYEEAVTWHAEGCSLYAADGCRPTIAPRVGAKPGTFGARISGREKFYAGAGAVFYVSKTGNDGTGTADDPTLPFLTISAAIAAASAGDCVHIQDSGIYLENLSSANALTIQAADGEVPTVRQAISTTALLTGKLTCYGLVLVSQPGAAAGVYTPTASVEFWDCSIRNTSFTLSTTSLTLRFESCSTDAYVTLAKATAFNSAVLTINNSRMGILRLDCITLCVVTVTQSTITGGVNRYSLAGTSDEGAYRERFHLCQFDVPVTFETAGYYTLGRNANGSGNPITGNTVIYSACVFNQNASAVTLLPLTTIMNNAGPGAGGSSAASGVGFAVNCLFQDGDYSDGKAVALDAGDANTYGWIGARNCVAVGLNKTGGIVTTADGLSATVLVRFKLIGFSIITEGDYGFFFDEAVTLAEFTRLVADGASTADLGRGSGSIVVTYSTASILGTGVSGTGTVQASPQFLGAVAGSENVALSASSPAIFTGDVDGTTDQGSSWGWVVNQVADAVLNGFVVTGPINRAAGLEVIDGVHTRAEFVTLSELGTSGFLGRRGSDVFACEGAQTNGPAFRLGGVSATAERCIAWGCAGAGFVFGAPDYTDSHNSAWGCEYGHYDAPLAIGTIINSIYSQNGVDVFTTSASVTYSDVITTNEDAVIGSGSIDEDPLQVDPFDGDLSLQTLAGGRPSDSPAKGTASDGSDMGAYEAEYGPLLDTFIELVLKGDDAPAGWLNPAGIPMELVPIKLTEGDKPGGGSFSAAKAIKRMWTMRWDTNSNMPQDQLIALNEVYADAGPVQVAFDGCTWVWCVVMKSTHAQNDQIDGLYTNSDIPRPISALVFMEI